MSPFPTIPSLVLLPEGAIFLSDSSILILADVHLGKSATFRAKGLPIPEGDTERDFQRAVTLVSKHSARHLVIAGDLFHAPSGITSGLQAALARFLSDVGIPVTLVMGNHDAKISGLPSGLGCLPSLDLGKICIVHDPAHAVGERIHISGHWHPVVKIPDGKRASLRLPCFLLRKHALVLPAFGSFTGGAIVSPEEGDRIFVALRENVVELPAELIF